MMDILTMYQDVQRRLFDRLDLHTLDDLAYIEPPFEVIRTLAQANVEYLAEGAFSLCYYNNTTVYSLLNGDDQTKDILCDVNHPLFAPVERLFDDYSWQLYKMPYYHVVESKKDLNKKQYQQYKALVELNEYSNIDNDMIDGLLPKKLAEGIKQLIDAANGYFIQPDIKLDGIGWVGDDMVIFDCFWIQG